MHRVSWRRTPVPLGSAVSACENRRLKGFSQAVENPRKWLPSQGLSVLETVASKPSLARDDHGAGSDQTERKTGEREHQSTDARPQNEKRPSCLQQPERFLKRSDPPRDKGNLTLRADGFKDRHR